MHDIPLSLIEEELRGECLPGNVVVPIESPDFFHVHLCLFVPIADVKTNGKNRSSQELRYQS